MLTYQEVLTGAEFLFKLPSFLRHPMQATQAKAMLRRRLEDRRATFLRIVQQAVYQQTHSPYRQLLQLAGCEYGDLERLVQQEGVEGTLQRLHREGMYLTVDTQKAQHIVGIDISAPIVWTSRSRHPGLQVAMADVRRLPFAGSSFDVIVSNSTLDHFHSQHEVVTSLYELHRVLRVGGQLRLTLDNLANPVIAMRNFLPFRLVNWLGLVPYYVGATYGPQGLGRIVQKVGFEVQAVEAIMHCPRVLVVALVRLIEGRIGLATQRHILRGLMTFERLAHWPTRFLTGHFIAVSAVKS